MRLEIAFKKAVQKYYEGFGYDSVKGALGKDFEYDFNTLDMIHQDLKNKSKPKIEKEEPEELEDLEEIVGEDDEEEEMDEYD